MVMTQEMMDVIAGSRAYVATATTDGVPNVVPIGNIKPLDNKTVIIADSYMIKTRKNLEANPKVAFVVEDAAKYPFQFKGTVKIYTSGEYYDEVVNWVKEASPLAPSPKAAVVIDIEEIYSVKVGDAGKKLD
ncbi:MAG: pyridoxamine 5'-phosphate oxidase family protein [Methanobacteriaceae archaeon]|jgi:predicted pyridoxine 5'-phosphate oxidase superfamily flavin-nucleotide-binding protein|nr:pyridoxamine 5'-phosphate oxidase family protein [Methanobacteriaceae archaeon]